MPEDKQGTVWVDLSDLLAWKGHFSGIQRVVYSYAERYNQQGARFFVYKLSTNRFVEISGVDYFAERKEQGITKKERLKLIYRAAVPETVRRKSSPLGRRVLHYGLLGASKAVKLVSRQEPLFAANDTIVILGAPWETPGMIDDLAAIKQIVGFKLVHLFHDLLPYSQSHLFDKQLTKRFNAYLASALPICDGVICVSQATRHDVELFVAQYHLRVPKHQVVVREGENTYDQITPTPLKGHDLEGGFIFSLGTLEVRKNHQLLYQAYKLAQQRQIRLPKLIIVGRPGWLAHDFFNVLKKDDTVTGQIIVIPGATDAEVLWLYEHCLFTIYPSLCEGWGLTIADSLGKGKLCLTANVSAMPEVAGELGDYFSPYDSAECLHKIHHYATQPEALAQKMEAIANYRPYTWDQSFAVIADFVRSVR